MFGWIIVQERGAPLTDDRDIATAIQHPLWCTMLRETSSRRLALGQFCVLGGRVMLADYGWLHLEPELKVLSKK
jgi:hypothetical protein